MAKAEVAYLYVISADESESSEKWVKIGRSTKPLQRRAQLQVGQGGKLIVRGQYPVLAAEAAVQEAKLKDVLGPLKIKGEVFRADDDLACAVAKWVAAGSEPDEFIFTAVAARAAALEWNAQLKRPSASGRWVKPETTAAIDAAWVEYTRLTNRLDEISTERADEVDPFRKIIRQFDEPAAPKQARRRSRGGANA